MGVMKKLYTDWLEKFIDRIIRETGYDWDYIYVRWCEATRRGVKPIDFFDEIVDEYCFNTGLVAAN